MELHNIHALATGQLNLPFDDPLDGDVKLSRKELAVINERIENLSKKLEQDYIEEGIKIFPVVRTNDQTSVESDYGAPSIGLDFYDQLLNAQRSYRYDPVKTVEGVYQTNVPQAISIGKSLKAQGYKAFKELDEDSYPSQIYFANGGVTRAFSDIVDNITDEFETIREVRKQYGVEQKGVILVPVPTYGLFLYRMEEAIRDKNIEVMTVHRRENGSVDRDSLRGKIAECQRGNKRIIGYYDCNPQNPTGYIREREETEKTAEIIIQANSQQINQDAIFLNSEIIEKGNKSPDLQKMFSYALGRPQGSITIIDDMAYEGLELVSDKKPYSFGQVSQEVAQFTAVLKGVSKIGIPGARIGMMVAHNEFTAHFAERQLTREFSANTHGVDILEARFGSSRFKPLFKSHTEKLKRKHRDRALTVKTFFRGIDNVDEFSDSKKKSLIKKYAQYSDIPIEEAEERLKKGLPNFYIGDQLECGFFQTIDCESLRGKEIAVKEKDGNYPSRATIHHGESLYWVFKAFEMKIVPGSWQGLPQETLTARMTISLPDDELFRFFDNMTEMHDYFFGERPEVQLDMFRNNQVSNTLTPTL